MKRHVALFTAASLMVGLVAFVGADEKKEEPKFKAVCPVSGKAAKEDQSAEYKGAKVYFCCGGCPDAFKKDTAKYATKANYQLAVTGQAKLVKCPLSGGKLNTETAIAIGDTKVCFCCENCQGKVKEAKGDEQIELVFNDKAFAKGFEIKKAKEEK